MSAYEASIGLDGYAKANSGETESGPALLPDELEAQRASLRARYPDMKV